MDKLLMSSIRTASKLLQDSVLTPTDLTNACLKQAKKNEHLNAFITLTADKAQELSAKSSDRFKNKSTLSELDGIPFTIKDNFCTAHIRTTCASRMLEQFRPTYSATVYEKLLGAGAVLLGKCNMDQFAMGSGTVDGIFGPTKNVWGYDGSEQDFHIAGGSSGGCAVAVASGSCFAAIGSDTGGSTRNPAAYCGLVGLKPTYGLVSRAGLIPLVNSMDVPGILTRSVDDCCAVLNVVAGHDPRDPTSLRGASCAVRLPPADRISLRGLCVGVPAEYHCSGLDQDALAAWERAAELLAAAGARVQQLSLPHTELSIACYSVLNQCEVASNMARYDGLRFGLRPRGPRSLEALLAAGRSHGFNEVVRNRILAGNYFLLGRNYGAYFDKALRVRRLIARDFDLAWEQAQVLLTPTTLSAAPLHSEFTGRTNRDQCATQDFCTQPANMAGVPAVSVPVGLSADGLPLAVQLVGPNLSERRLLAVAKVLEHAAQFERRAPTS